MRAEVRPPDWKRCQAEAQRYFQHKLAIWVIIGLSPFRRRCQHGAPRVYRHDVRCPECRSNRMPKDGTSKGKGRQVYHCGDCGRRTIPDAAYQRPSATDQERALAMYRRAVP